MSHATHHHRLHAPGKIYVFLLAVAVFGILSRCGGPDFAPARALGAESETAAPASGTRNIPPPPADFRCGWPFMPLYDLTGRRWICYAEPNPPAEPHSRASEY